MASSPSKADQQANESAIAESSVGFALEEMIACWSQAHEAMHRGDLQSVESLITQADLQLPIAGDGQSDTPSEARLRQRAASAYGVLRHAMEAGLTGIRKELSQARRGQKALRGYVDAAGHRDGKLLKSV